MEAELTALNTEIVEVRAAITRRKKMKTHLKRLNTELADRRRQIRYLTSTVRKEAQDVNKLQGLSVRAMFQKALGSLRDQLEIERQEYLLAALRYNDCIDLIEVLEYEVALVEGKLAELPPLQERFGHLLKKKLEILRRPENKASSQLRALDAQEHSLHIKRVEYDEAIIAGDLTTRRLKTMHNLLQKVKNWGNYELQGSGRYSSYAKKSYIDKARRTALDVKVALDKFETEVQDVLKQEKIRDRFDIGRFEKFLETFYDNLITDWIVQKGTSNQLYMIRTVADKVSRIMATLKAEHRKIKSELRAIERMQKKIVLSC